MLYLLSYIILPDIMKPNIRKGCDRMQNHYEHWIDALDFETKGGWKEDTQYVHLMGSGYLIAADEPGVPVENATITLQIPVSGTYRVWVRDRNWLRPHNPGQFQVLLDGKETGNILGKMPSDKWIWEIAGDVTLDAGSHTLTVQDLTGYFARFASILLTTDMDYVPSREISRIQADRARIKGVDNRIKEGDHYDLIVAGGGPGGCPTAIAAARKGARVLLIQNRPTLGGNGSSEVGITFDGATSSHLYARESGIAEEIRRLRDRETEFHGDWERAITKLVAAESNITVLYNNHVYDADMESPSKIRGVYTLNIRTLERAHYTADLFADCTGDAWLGYFAGAKMRFGREGKWQHSETIAPDLADTLTMSGCIKSDHIPFFFDAGENAQYHAPSWVPELPKNDDDFGRAIHGIGTQLPWWLEAPNTYDDLWDGEEARDALLMVVLGYYDHIKNYWSKKEEVANKRLRFVSIFNGRRESRRLIGDYIMTEEDATSGRRFEDAVSYSGWAVDLHHPEGIYSGKKGPLYAALKIPMPTIPYRCLYSANIDNLMFAGRNISVTHIALGTVRVQNTIAALGQAVGTAAAMCIKLKETPRGIYQKHMKALQQQLLKDDMFIPGLVNEDEGDPCRTATVTASSVSTTEVFAKKHGAFDKFVSLDLARKGNLSFNTLQGDIDELWLWLSSENNAPATVKVGVQVHGDVDSIAQNVKDFWGSAEVPAHHAGWVKVNIHIPVTPTPHHPGGRLNVWIEPAEGIFWRHMNNLSFYNMAGYRDEVGTWHMSACHNFDMSIKKPDDIIADCAPENVINGISRIRSSEIYEWVSDPNETLPQWLQLDLKESTKINQVSLVFNTDMTNPGTCWGLRTPNVPLCVKDYNVEIFTAGRWLTVADVTENFMRKRNHRFPDMVAEKIRINVLQTWGCPSARITEVRASLED